MKVEIPIQLNLRAIIFAILFTLSTLGELFMGYASIDEIITKMCDNPKLSMMCMTPTSSPRVDIVSTLTNGA